ELLMLQHTEAFWIISCSQLCGNSLVMVSFCSNMTVHQCTKQCPRKSILFIWKQPGLKHKPVSNQVECHPDFRQPKLLEYCRQNDIMIVSYCQTGSSRDASWVNLKCPPLLGDEVSAQVALRLNIQRGVVVIPKSFKAEQIKHNFQILDFSLTEEEIKAIEALNKNIRFVELLMWIDHPEYPFHDEY
uniref:NADP-dependent oxidoreductase domain-containing protein n=1 Tax=Pundamilia nyererei TaxID=303518 RepID=A0A3B4ESI0_9CICH